MSQNFNLRNCREVREFTNQDAVNRLLEDPAWALIDVRVQTVKTPRLERTRYDHDYGFWTKKGEIGHVLESEELQTKYIVGRFDKNGSTA